LPAEGDEEEELIGGGKKIQTEEVEGGKTFKPVELDKLLESKGKPKPTKPKAKPKPT